MSWLANVAYLGAGIAYSPFLLYQMTVQKKNRTGWRERFGYIAPRPPVRPAVWIHAVSLGEVNATRTLVAELQHHNPPLDIILSATTDTGFAQARKLYPQLRVIRYPLDFSWMVDRVLDRLQPALIVLMELEVWYHLVTRAAARNIPVCVANGRFTQRSFERLQWLGRFVQPMFTPLSWVGAQTAEIAERFRRMGVAGDRVEVVGSIKWDTTEVTDAVAGSAELRHALQLQADRPVVVLGSSGPGEEDQLLDNWPLVLREVPETQLVIVPRKPERFDEVAQLINRRGYPCIRRSLHPDRGVATSADERAEQKIYLGDTLGELRKFYSLADVVIIGRTFMPMGGSDPMEVAALGKPMIVGPHVENFSDPVAQLCASGALLQVATFAQAIPPLVQWLKNANIRQPAGAQGVLTVQKNQGATRRTIRQLQSLLTVNRTQCGWSVGGDST
ncbi:MAG: 3-deoxy-D-manno-octulosonic acid transferase [Phycisphaerae bacterium]|nr:3-deoxy-D-manno-octulosonic acid transferase [Phycisphaerae bacterium]